jgi:hypothetical protein
VARSKKLKGILLQQVSILFLFRLNKNYCHKITTYFITAKTFNITLTQMLPALTFQLDYEIPTPVLSGFQHPAPSIWYPVPGTF